MQSCIQGRLQCSRTSLLLNQHRFPSPVARGAPDRVQRTTHITASYGKGASNALSWGALSSHFILRGGVDVCVKSLPHCTGLDRSRKGTAVTARIGAYNREAFVDDEEAQKLAQVW
jgi:hypothetical protein